MPLHSPEPTDGRERAVVFLVRSVSRRLNNAAALCSMTAAELGANAEHNFFPFLFWFLEGNRLASEKLSSG